MAYKPQIKPSLQAEHAEVMKMVESWPYGHEPSPDESFKLVLHILELERQAKDPGVIYELKLCCKTAIDAFRDFWINTKQLFVAPK